MTVQGNVLGFPILTLITFGFFIRLVRIPAVIVLGFWIVVQVLNGFLTFSLHRYTETTTRYLRRGRPRRSPAARRRRSPPDGVGLRSCSR